MTASADWLVELGPWGGSKIRGQSGPPKSVDSAEVVLKVVSKLTGASGLVWAKKLLQNVKVLKVDRKRPGEPGYPLRT